MGVDGGQPGLRAVLPGPARPPPRADANAARPHGGLAGYARLWAHLSHRCHPAEIFQGTHYGTIFGTLMLAAIVGGAAGPWVTGVLHDATGSYTLAFWIAIGCSALSAGAIWLAGPRQVRAVAGRVRP